MGLGLGFLWDMALGLGFCNMCLGLELGCVGLGLGFRDIDLGLGVGDTSLGFGFWF